MIKFLIAYKDKYGKDYDGYPFIIDFGQNEIVAKDNFNKMTTNGYKDVILFKIKESDKDNLETMNVITWEFAKDNSIL